MKLDSHQHFWQIDRGDYAWMSPGLTALYRDFMPHDLEPEMRAAGVSESIVVQAAATLAESRFLLDIAQQCDFVVGVVGWVDMASPKAAHDLAALSESRWLKGIRPMIEFIADPDWMLGSQVAGALEALADQQLCFDAVIKPIHLPRLLHVAGAHPKLRIVIDHGAKPDIARGAFHPWSEQIAGIARFPNVFCKLSGLLTEASPGATLETLEPYMQHLLDCFGIDRLVWGSDWPVMNLASNYLSWSHMCERFLEPLDGRAQEAILSRNARECYRL